MIHKRLRDYDRSPVFSSRFQNLAGEHGKVGFKYTANNFVCNGCTPVPARYDCDRTPAELKKTHMNGYAFAPEDMKTA